MGSRRYWIVVGVLAVLVGLIVFAMTSTSSGEESAPTPATDAVTSTDAVSTTVRKRDSAGGDRQR